MITGHKGRFVAKRKDEQLFLTFQNIVQPLLIHGVLPISWSFIFIKSDTKHRPNFIVKRQIFFTWRSVVRQTASTFKYFLPNRCSVRAFASVPTLLLLSAP